jgi:flavin-dependent dehydrogenase
MKADAIVIGGGPAGSTAAALLASWGRSVVLVHRETAQPSLAESLPWSTRKLLRHVGLLHAIDLAQFHPNHGNTSLWAGHRTIAATDGAGFHVSRREFDRVLREQARLNGASIVDGTVSRVEIDHGAAVTCVVRPKPDSTTMAGGRTTRYDADFVLDCSGRAGVIARRGLRRADAGYRTLAIAAEWECPEWPAAERSHTFIDSYENGWAWSVPVSATRRQCTVMVDAGLTVVSKARLESLYRTELRQAVSIADRLAAASQVGAAWCCDASLYTCERAFEACALLVGDAASFIEPLSSAGVKKAIASAWRAAIVVNTALASPDMRGVATAFHDRRERWLYGECVRRSQVFFARASAVYDNSFWSTRAEYLPADQEGAPPTDSDVMRDRDVQRIAEQLRAAEAVRLTISPTLVITRAPFIEGNRIRLRDAVALNGGEEPLRFVCGVDLLELSQVALTSCDVSSAIQQYFARVGPVDPRNLLVGLAFLVSRGALGMAQLC